LPATSLAIPLAYANLLRKSRPREYPLELFECVGYHSYFIP
jgi:hypothetical protein